MLELFCAVSLSWTINSIFISAHTGSVTSKLFILVAGPARVWRAAFLQSPTPAFIVPLPYCWRRELKPYRQQVLVTQAYNQKK